MSDLTQSEEVTYLTKTAYTDGLNYLQDNFVTKSGLFTDSALTEGMSDLFLSSLKTAVYILEIDKSATYNEITIYKEGYRAVFIANAMSTDVIVLGVQIQDNNLKAGAYYKPLSNDADGTGYIEFTVYYTECENEETEEIETNIGTDLSGPVTWTQWATINGKVYSDQNYNWYMSWTGGKNSSPYSGVGNIDFVEGTGAKFNYSSAAKTYYYNYKTYYTEGRIACLYTGMPASKTLKSVKWKSNSNTEYTDRWIVIEFSDDYHSFKNYSFYGTKHILYYGCATQSGVIETVIYDKDTSLTSGHLTKGNYLRLYGNGITITEVNFIEYQA